MKFRSDDKSQIYYSHDKQSSSFSHNDSGQVNEILNFDTQHINKCVAMHYKLDQNKCLSSLFSASISDEGFLTLIPDLDDLLQGDVIPGFSVLQRALQPQGHQNDLKPML